MCYDPTASPPPPPIAGGATDPEGRDLVLESADGTRFAAFSATTGTAGGAGMAILPDVRGLHRFYRELAMRFAEAGVHATAIDWFGRTAGLGERDDDFEYMPHVTQTKPDQIAQDVGAALSHLRSPDGGSSEALFTVGFCFGGRQSFNQAAAGQGLSGVIGFYGAVEARPPYPEETAPIRLAPNYRCPVLGLFGGADQHITSESIEKFRAALDGVGVRNEMVVYDGAPHSFFDRTFVQYKNECDDAWRRILRFIQDAG